MSDQPGNEHKRGELAEEILSRIVADPDFRQQLLNNPAETLAQAGYLEGDDVSGYSMRQLGLRGTLGGIALGGHTERTTAITCPPEPPVTTAINCGGGGISTAICSTDPPEQGPKPGLSHKPTDH